MKYRNNTYEVEARQITAENAQELAEWCGGTHTGPPNVLLRTIRYPITEGEQTALVGHWLIRFPDGNFTHCTSAAFHDTFSPVPESCPVQDKPMTGAEAIGLNRPGWEEESKNKLPPDWPWDDEWWKPGPAKRMLEKAGALIAAEWDRLDREERLEAFLAPIRKNPDAVCLKPGEKGPEFAYQRVREDGTVERIDGLKLISETPIPGGVTLKLEIPEPDTTEPVTTQVCPCCQEKRPLTMDLGQCHMCGNKVLTCCLSKVLDFMACPKCIPF